MPARVVGRDMGIHTNFFNTGNAYVDDQRMKNLQMDIAYTNMQFISLKKANSKQVFLTALQSSDYRLKAAACLMAFDYGLDYIDDLIDAVASPEIVLSQSARQTLIRLSNKLLCGEEEIKKAEQAAKDKNSKAAPKTNVVNKNANVVRSNNTHYVDFGPNVFFMQNESLIASQNLWKVWYNEKAANKQKSKN